MPVYVVAHPDGGDAIAAVDSLERAFAVAWVEAYLVWQETAESDEAAAKALEWTMTCNQNVPRNLRLSARPPWRREPGVADYTITVIDGDFPAIVPADVT